MDKKAIIKKVYNELNQVGQFVLFGSTNLWLQGMPIESHDIDFVSSDEGVIAAAKIFDSKALNKNGYMETKFEMNGVEIEVVSNSDNPHGVSLPAEDITEIDILGEKVSCATLEHEYKFYSALNRPKDQEKLKFLKSKINT